MRLTLTWTKSVSAISLSENRRCAMNDATAMKLKGLAFMTANATTGTIRLHRVLRTTPEKIYRCLLYTSDAADE